MRAVLQRVSRASVEVDGTIIAEVGQGLLILLGISPGDDSGTAAQLAGKTAQLRIFDDADEKMNLSLLDIGGEALVVSQFTLYADTSRGRRPSFIGAAQPDQAAPLVLEFAEQLEKNGIPAQTGEFGADMKVSLVNDGPVTIILEI